MTLRADLEKLDGRSYGHYRELRRGRFELGNLALCFDHVQGDPFAAPSRVSLHVPGVTAALPDFALRSGDARRAAADFVHRRLAEALPDAGAERRGSGKSGQLAIAGIGPEVLERTSVVVGGDGALRIRLTAGLPAAGRRILGRAAADLVAGRLPDAVSGLLERLDHARLETQVRVVEDQVALREALDGAGLVGFLAEGSLLPRLTGADPRPLPDGLPLEVPDALVVELDAPHAGRVRGLGIPQGVTLIVGGGYHGKSTLLSALALGVYDHVPGDGRERCVTLHDAVSLRAEDGRSVRGVDLRPFISELPRQRSTRNFDSDDASGSTSQAAATIEALEAGARVFLIDEDTAATNFMIRDARMRRLIPAGSEPITPYLDRVQLLWQQRGVSSVLVVGGAGDYLDVADRVIQLDAYRPVDVTERARRVARELPLAPSGQATPAADFTGAAPRRPEGESLDPRRGRRPERVRSVRTRTIEFGREEIDVSLLYQLVDPAQCRAIGDALLCLHRGLADGRRGVGEVLDALDRIVSEEGLDAICEPGFGDRARPRRFEIAAALNRLRSLRLRD
jgi:predicted ABC-class ATPase